MRKLIVLEHISIDGVIQSPGGRQEDSKDGFEHGGWSNSFSDPAVGAAFRKQMNSSFDLLLGRKTFDVWESYWPGHADIWPSAARATKYICSNTRTSGNWGPSVFLSGDIAAQIAKLKQQQGPDLHCWGSADLVQTLSKNDLIDRYWLVIYPVTIGSGKKLFTHGAIPAAFKVTDSLVSPDGVIVVTYERDGALKTGDR